MRARPITLTVALLWTLLVVATTAALMHVPIGVSCLTLSLSVTGLVALSDDQRRAKADRIREALSILRIPITTAARQYMQMDPADLERGLSGDRKLDAWRLEMLGPEFQRVLDLAGSGTAGARTHRDQDRTDVTADEGVRMKETVRRLLWALLVASLLAIGLAKLNAQDDEEYQPVYYPGICHYLEPYGWWWYFYDCASDNNLTTTAPATTT
jgi:hypothetical protein